MAVLTVGAWIGLAAVAVERSAIAHQPGAGLDLSPLADAGRAVLQGRSIYAHSQFVYPPPAAVLSVPLSLLSWPALQEVWVVAQMAAVICSAVICSRFFQPRWWKVAAPLEAMVLLNSGAVLQTLRLGNISLLLLPVCAVALILFGRQQWVAGSSVVMVSLLIKPLLVPLLVLPLCYGQWRAVIRAAVPVALVGGASLLAVPGGADLAEVLHRVADGSNLTGRMAVYNLSLSGLFSVHGLADALLPGRIAVGAAAVYVLVRWRQRPVSFSGTVVAGGVVLVAVFLGGNLAEVHYLPLLLVPSVAVLVGWRVHPAAASVAVIAVILLLAPGLYLHGVDGPAEVRQWRYVAGEAGLLVAFALTLLAPGTGMAILGDRRDP